MRRCWKEWLECEQRMGSSVVWSSCQLCVRLALILLLLQMLVTATYHIP